MLGGLIRLVIVFVTLGIAWNATGDVMAMAWQDDPWKGHAGALGVELVLAYAIFTLAKTTQRGIIGVMIVAFGLVSIAAQILHSWAFGRELPAEIVGRIPAQIIWAWRYLLPSIPTLAGMCVGILDVAEQSKFNEREFIGKLGGMWQGLKRNAEKLQTPVPQPTLTMAASVEPVTATSHNGNGAHPNAQTPSA